ncbi:unnamed protein product [Cochlearia groenlandica]
MQQRLKETGGKDVTGGKTNHLTLRFTNELEVFDLKDYGKRKKPGEETGFDGKGKMSIKFQSPGRNGSFYCG